MTRLTAAEAKAEFSSLLVRAEAGEAFEITRHGLVVARLVPARSPRTLRGAMSGVARSRGADEGLFSTGAAWTTS